MHHKISYVLSDRVFSLKMGNFLYDINNKMNKLLGTFFSINILFALQAPISNFHQYFCT
jgi:hypothetical protein